MRLTVQDQYLLLGWAAKRIGTDKFPEESEAIGVIKSDEEPEPRAVIIINALYERQCSMHIASDRKARWASSNILGGIFGYVFLVKKIDRVNAIIAQDNMDAQIMALKLGFRFEGNLRRGGLNGTDAILLSMTADQCRWIEQKEQSNG